MLTYIINTSENKTFDSDGLFRLVGYNKIQWLNCSLSDIEDCVEVIKNKQGAIEAEEFRIAVLVDFYGFDKVRAPYGKNGYASDEGVECCIYLPYIESYIKDRLLYVLEKQEYFSASCDVYYIKSGNFVVHEHVSNLEAQTYQILSPVDSTMIGEKQIKTPKVYDEDDDKGHLKGEQVYDENGKVVFDTVTANTYSQFELYCTRNLTLKFNVDDYPYGLFNEQTNCAALKEFFIAFNDRCNKNRRISRHFYHTSVGGSPARAAFENLALSLHLISFYEREQEAVEEGDVEVEAIDPTKLKDLLVDAWNKIVTAQKVAKENKSLYYSLKNIAETQMVTATSDELSEEEIFEKEKSRVTFEGNYGNITIDEQFNAITNMGKKSGNGFLDADKKEFDEILSGYLTQRDKMNEHEVDVRFSEMINECSLETTNQCPSRQEFDYIVSKKHDEISTLMSRTLNAEYIEKDFEEEKRNAKTYYEDYLTAKKVLNRNIIGDIIFLLLTVAFMIAPFVSIKAIIGISAGTVVLFLMTAGVFAGLFILSLLLSLLPAIQKIRSSKKKMAACYGACLAKKKVALYKIRRRYEVELINIEELRYEIRQITFLYKTNVNKDKNVNKHRVMLEEVENILSAILNNLGIHPVLDEVDDIDEYFDLSKPINSIENKVYKIFSLDAIESIIVRKKTEVK